MGLGFWVHGIMIGVCFVVILMTSSSDSNEPILWLKAFLDSRLEYESLVPLIEFPAFLVQKLCQKKSKYFRNFLADLGDFPNWYSIIFPITFQPETLQCRSNPLKTRTIAYNPFKSSKALSHEIVSIVELPRDVDVIQCFARTVETCQNILWLCKHGQKGQQPTLKFFFQSKLHDFTSP